MTQQAKTRLASRVSVTALMALSGLTGVFSALLLTGNLGAAASAREDASTEVRRALEHRLPKTKITSVDCSHLNGVCEVAAGPNVFYVDRAARYLVIGRVYDMETRQDLTAARILELNPDALTAGAARADGANAEGEGAGQGARQEVATKVSLQGLPANGAVRWGNPSGPKVTIFSDVRCGYCKRVGDELRQIGAAVEERPISSLGTRQLSEAIMCSSNPVSALHAAYVGETPNAARRCDTSGLDANEAFAKAHGFSGTPVLVRADGAVIQGWRSASELSAWLKGAA